MFSGPVTTYHAGEGNRILLPVMGEHSVLTTDEHEHRRIRKLLMPPFHGAALRGYRTMVTELAQEEIGRWQPGEPFRSHDSMQRLTFEIILRVVFGVSDGPRLDDLRRTLSNVIAISALDIFGWHSARMQRYGRWRRNKEMLEHADELIYAEIADRRNAEDLAERTDVLSRLISTSEDGDALSDAELRDQLVTLLLAGHETTATALAWAFHELARSPRILAKATEAAEGGDDRYLEAVAKEAMRLLAFGGGVRRCLGAGFSLMESVEVLRAVLTRYRIEPDRPKRERVKPRNITLPPARGGRIAVTPR